MGQVFLGRSAAGRLVAVKLIRAEYARDADFRARFRREVAAARTVSGIFTAPVVDANPDDVRPWLVTAYVEGPSLDEEVRIRGPLALGAVLSLAAGLAEGLSAIHSAGVVHRDLKPSNVLLAADGPRIIDFGIAQAMDATRLTSAGWAVGTPAFMSPEQADGGQVGPPGDIFSLGAVLTFAVTGEGPFGHGNPAALLYRIAHRPPAIGGLPPQIQMIVERCLAKAPQQRPTPDELLDELSSAHSAASWSALLSLRTSQAGAWPSPTLPATPGASPRPEQSPTQVAGEPADHPADALGDLSTVTSPGRPHAPAAPPRIEHAPSTADRPQVHRSDRAEDAVRLLCEAEQVLRESDAAKADPAKIESRLLDVVAAMACADATRAQRLARSFTVHKAWALTSVADAIADTDPARAARLLNDAQQTMEVVKPFGDHLDALARVVRAIGRIEPAAAERLLEAEQQIAHKAADRKGQLRLGTDGNTIVDSDWESYRLAAIAEAAAGFDVDRAEQIAGSVTNRHIRSIARVRIACAIADHDLARAEQIVRSLTSRHPPFRTKSAPYQAAIALAKLGASTARTDPARATQFLAEAEQLARDSARPEYCLIHIAVATTGVDRDRAELIAGSITDEEPRSAALGQVALAVADVDPEQAEQLAHSISIDSNYWRSKIAEAIAIIDPARAASVARSDLEGMWRARTLARVAEKAVDSSPAFAAELLAEAEQLARSTEGDWALVSVAAAAVRVAPARAEPIARSVSTQELLATSLIAVARAWLDMTPPSEFVTEALRSWLVEW